MSHSPTRIPLSLISLAIVATLVACSPKTEPAQAPADTATATSAAEPVPTPQSNDVKTFAIGELQATALRDGALEFPNDNQVFGVGHTPDEVAVVLGAAGAPTDKVQLSLQPLLVKTADRVLLFDTGAGKLFGPTVGHVQASFAAAGIDPASVTDIFISHAHGDHIGGLVNDAGTLAFPNAAIHLSAPEWDFVRSPDVAKMIGADKQAAFVAAVTPKVATFAPGSDLIEGVVKAVEAKGHTPGHSAYLIGSGENTLLYIGDSAHSSIVSVQKPEWPISFDGDQAVGIANRKALIEANAASGQRIYAVHFPFPGIGKFEKRGDGYVWVAE